MKIRNLELSIIPNNFDIELNKYIEILKNIQRYIFRIQYLF